MAERAFPVIFARRVSTTAGFYERLGFARHFQLPPEGEPGYVGLRRGSAEVAVIDAAWPQDQYGGTVGDELRFEMFVYVDEVDATVEQLRGDGTAVLCEPSDMPWGERVAYVTDPTATPSRWPHPSPTTPARRDAAAAVPRRNRRPAGGSRSVASSGQWGPD
jgi:lactoylglutathione lyase